MQLSTAARRIIARVKVGAPRAQRVETGRFGRELLSLVAFIGGSLACRASESADGRRAEALASPALASDSAFDLRATSSGAVLAWIEGQSRVLRWARLDPRGVLAGDVGALELGDAPDPIGDLNVLDVEHGLAFAWLTGEGRAARVWGAWHERDAEPRAYLMAPASVASAGRGNVALGAQGEGAVVLVRGAEEACALGESGPCHGFEFYRLGADNAEQVGLALRVPQPCERWAAQLPPPRSGPSRDPGADRQYAICSRSSGNTALTAFTIEPARQYASAEVILPGCTPLGAGVFAGASGFVGQCGPTRRVAFVSAEGPVRLVDLEARGVLCDGDTPRVRLGDGWWRLSEPASLLELLLDHQLAPPTARAAWTGAALVVAVEEEGRVALRVSECSGSRLETRTVLLASRPAGRAE